MTLDKFLNGSPVVRVGQALSFTIILTNDAGFTLTNVTLVDNYSQNVLGFAGATPGPDSVDPATGTIIWNNVAAPPLAPGQTLMFTVFFTAEHPQTAVVNMVRAQDITGTGTAISDTNDSDQIDESIGGRAPIDKEISPPGSAPQVGLPVTFTHLITNDGAAIMTFLPLTDTYNPAVLQFNFAIPTPTITSPPGLLVWTDLTNDFGDIPPFGTIVVTTVFTTLASFVGDVNQASTAGARDQYDNDLADGFDQVPITIIADENNKTNNNNNDDDEEDTPAPTATMPVLSTATPAIIPTPEQSITDTTQVTDTSTLKYLPETGHRAAGSWLTLVGGFSLLALGWYLYRKLTIGN
ncbi:MAG: LPXTG cell wall anchor domain-containing protein [Chloroflexi bacterium]|nr:LPXTG cell wall anchor domain-containing protein [Chloroflexota bacterium]